MPYIDTIENAKVVREFVTNYYIDDIYRGSPELFGQLEKFHFDQLCKDLIDNQSKIRYYIGQRLPEHHDLELRILAHIIELTVDAYRLAEGLMKKLEWPRD
jgi:hypothetical protein